ncbi:hypothetical protein GcM1_137002, partial [Golovinomyces cichoracearum]
ISQIRRPELIRSISRELGIAPPSRRRIRKKDSCLSWYTFEEMKFKVSHSVLHLRPAALHKTTKATSIYSKHPKYSRCLTTHPLDPPSSTKTTHHA